MLGPLRLCAGSRSVPVGPQKPRAMLAHLLLCRNERVSLERLAAELWDRPPRSAVANLRTYASGLRQLLAECGDSGDRLVAHASGYLLRVDPPDLDVCAFESAAEAGRALLGRDDVGAASERLHSALALWHGRPIEDVRPGPDLTARVAQLDEQRLTVTEDLVAARLALAEHVAVTADLRLLVAAHPFRERLRHQLMLALYRSGDAPGALAAYTEMRAALAEHLGIEPGAELARLHQAILRRAPELSLPDRPAPDATVDPPAGAPSPPSTSDGRAPSTSDGLPERGTPPRQLPPAPVAFVGRVEELCAITAACAAAPPGGSAVVVLHGPGGIGKTTLAVRAAHRLADRYPDGQLHVDLHGGAAGLPGLDPAHALGRLLRALGVDAGDVPVEVDEAAARFRSETAGRRLLIVLDGAAGAQQVRPLLPGGAGCAVIVTCRRPMSTLDAVRLRLDRLPDTDGIALIAALAGAQRTAADPAAAGRLVALCDGHPLALRIAGARLAERTDWPLAALADRLGDERDRLDELAADDLAIRSSFRDGYNELADSASRSDREAAALFRALALLRLPQVPAAVAATLVDVPERRAVTLLDRLRDCHLVEAVTPTRFRLHDLLRLYATELADRFDPAPARELAVARALTAYLNTAVAAGRLLRAGQPDTDPGGPVLAALDTLDDAVRWLEVELPGVIAAAGQAAGLSAPVSRLCTLLVPRVTGWLQKCGRWAEAEALAAAVEQAAGNVGDRAAEARVLAVRATLDWHTGRTDAAQARLEGALAIWRQLGDRDGEGLAMQNLGWLYHRVGRVPAAADAIRAGVRLLDGGDPVRLGVALHNLAEVEFELGEYAAACGHLERSLAIRRELVDPVGEGITLVALGRAYSQLGRHDAGLAALDAGLGLCRRTGNREDEWEALLSRSEVHLRVGAVAAARRDVDEALDLVRRAGSRYGEAAATRQRALVLRRDGQDGPARDDARRADRLLAGLTDRRDGVLEAFLGATQVALLDKLAR
ncbi:SARP family transcriptional regulator [Virgisporangium aurantiacum]|uniref:SARP family transcriptional regulator n=1 Tax=Virgisporangium aurantiacum TaxID=175570 RepID=A0A8J4E0L5_9ACTN|nr:SARP family transcriptional regulator [Virgisporangium aurantiacum]